MKIFVICPVRMATAGETSSLDDYVSNRERNGDVVHWPARDTDQKDPVGLRICTDNCKAITEADEVHIWFNPASQGSLFDIGIAFALQKKIRLINPEMVAPTEGKSFANVLLALHNKTAAQT